MDSYMDNSADNMARPLDSPSDNPLPMDTPMDTVPLSSDSSSSDSSPPGDSLSVSSQPGLLSCWQGYTHVPLPVVGSPQGCTHAAHPSCWQGHTHVPHAYGDVSPRIHLGSLSPPRHIPRSSTAAPLPSPTVAMAKLQHLTP